MLKQLLPISILLIGVIASVFLIKNSTLLGSKAYDLLDFIPAFNSTENDSRYSGNLDVYKDGIINVFDVIKDRYMQQATKSGTATNSAEASKSAEASNSAQVSATPIPTPTPTPTPTPAPNAAGEYNRILNSQGTSEFK